MGRCTCLLAALGGLAAVSCWASDLSQAGDLGNRAAGEGSGFWDAWWRGDGVDSYSIFGQEMHFWKRIGKGLLFLAGLSIVVDIIGSAGLRQMGNSLGRMSLFNRAVAELRQAWAYVRAINRATYGKVPETEANALTAEALQYLVRPLSIGVVVVLLAGVLAILYANDSLSWWSFLLASFLCLAISPAVILLASFLLSVPGLVCDRVILRPAARLLEMPDGEKYIRVFMLSSFVVGSIVDFIAD